MSKTIKYSKVRNLNDKDFKRVIGAKRDTFKDMVKVVNRYYRERKVKGGTTRALSTNDEVLLMLEYSEVLLCFIL